MINETSIWIVGIICVVISMYGMAAFSPKDGEKEVWIVRLSKKIFSTLRLL